MDFTAVQDAIHRAAEVRNVEKKEDAFHDAIEAYESLCASIGIVPKLDYSTQLEKQEVDRQLQSKVATLTNALVLSKGLLSPCIIDLNAEISNLYVQQVQITRRLHAEYAIHVAADELVRAVDTSHDLDALTEHEHAINKLQTVQSRDSLYVHTLLVILLIVNTWMLTNW